MATVTIIITAAIIILLVPCWSLDQSQDNIQKTLTNESPRFSVGSNALICNSLNSLWHCNGRVKYRAFIRLFLRNANFFLSRLYYFFLGNLNQVIIMPANYRLWFGLTILTFFNLNIPYYLFLILVRWTRLWRWNWDRKIQGLS